LYNKCIFCGFEGDKFEEIIRKKSLSSNDDLENMKQITILLKCPKCSYETKSTYGYSNDKKILEKISKE
jgi:uncharacterized Zn finger protein